MCRHVLCERRSKTKQELSPGPRLPQAVPVSVTIGAGESCGPYPRLSDSVAGHWFQKIVTKDGS